MRSSPMVAAVLVALSYAATTSAQQQTSRADAVAAPTTLPAAPRQISGVTVQKSSWNSMAVTVDYATASPDATTLYAFWTKRNGRAVSFTPVSMQLPPDGGAVTLRTQHTGVLPPPNKLVMTLSLRSAGHTIAQYDCDLWLLNQKGTIAWAADLAKREPLTWSNRGCRPKR